LEWPQQEASTQPSRIEGNLRSTPLLCQQAVEQALTVAKERVEFAYAWTDEQKARQRYTDDRVTDFILWAKDHTSMATLCRYFYELPKEESGVLVLAAMIEESFMPFGTGTKAKKPGRGKKKSDLDQVDELLDILVVLRANAVDGGWYPPPPKWRPFPQMSHARCNFAMVTLAGGGLLVAGGWDGPARGWDEGGHVLGSAEVLMPGEQGWRRIGDLPTPRHGCTACVLQDARVMVVGGSDENLGPMRTVETWEPSTGAWRKTTSTFGEHANAAVCTLPDGRVLVAGGHGGGRSTEVYDPQMDSWSLLADMKHPTAGGRIGCSAVSLGGAGNAFDFLSRNRRHFCLILCAQGGGSW